MNKFDIARYGRLSVLLMDVCPFTLRRIFENYYILHGSLSLQDFLEKNKHEVYHLMKTNCCCKMKKRKSAIMNKSQWDSLYTKNTSSCQNGMGFDCPCQYYVKPGITTSVMDLLLCFLFIKNLCPGITINMVHIDTIREVRNRVAHSNSASLDEPTYRHYWNRVAYAILDIAKNLSPALAIKTTKMLKDLETQNEEDNAKKKNSQLEKLTDDSTIPSEIRAMDSRSLALFTKALKEGKYKSYVIRVMIVGHYRVGKTTLTKKLLGLDFDPSKYESTEGLEIYVGHCFMDRDTRKWTRGEKRKANSVAEDLRNHGIIDDMKVEVKNIDEKRTEEEKTSESDVERGGEILYERVHESSDNKEHMEGTKVFIKDSSVGDPDIHSNLLKEILERDSLEEEKCTSIEIWDFGGQGCYGATHQLFLSHRSIYLLVFDISKKLDEDLEDMDLDPSERRKATVKEFLSFWINSIKTYGGDGMGNHPKILIVGTHLDEVDEVERSQRIEEYMLRIQEAYAKDIVSGQLILQKNLMFGFHAEDNIEILQKTIAKTTEDQSYWGEELPKAWIPFQHHVFQLRQSGKKILPLDEIKIFNELLPAPLDAENIDLCLRFLHSIGSIIFHGSGLSNFVILEPMLLVDALRSLITFKDPDTEGSRKGAYESLQHDGFIHRDQIEEIWNLDKFSAVVPFKQHLLAIMEKLDLIAKPKASQKGSSENVYFIPAMMKVSANNEWLTSIIKCNMVQTFEIDFGKKFLSPAVYYRVISSCISMWPVYEKNLYFGCCQLSLDPHSRHKMLIRKKGDKICLLFEHTRGACSIDKTLISNVAEKVVGSLNQIMNETSAKDLYEVRWIDMSPIAVQIAKESLEMNYTRFIKELANPEDVTEFLSDDPDQPLIDGNMKKEIKAEKSTETKTMKLIETLLKRGERVPQKLYEALMETGNKELALCVKPYIDMLNKEKQKTEPTKWPPDAEDIKQMLRTKIKHLKPKDPVVCGYFNKPDAYNMGGRRRGICLIINIMQFEKKESDKFMLGPRIGSKRDADNLGNVFRELHFLVQQRTSLTSSEILREVGRVARDVQETDNCVVLAILSHGCKDGIYGKDSIPVKLEEIKDEFHPVKCPELNEKPKIFFIQACRGDLAETLGASVNAMDGKSEDQHTTDTINDVNIKSQIQETLTVSKECDFLIANSTPEGAQSWRHEIFGSWFILAVVWVFRLHAHEMSLTDLLHKVNRFVSRGKAKPGDGNYVTVSTSTSSFTRHLYFFPGIYDKNGSPKEHPGTLE